MSYDKRKRNRKIRAFFRMLMLISIIIYLIFRSVPTLIANNAKIILPERYTMVEKFLAEGFIIKDEKVIRSIGNGVLETISKEGERVPSGKEVATYNSLNDTSSLKEEIVQLDETIVALQKTENDTKLILNEKEKVESMKDELVDELQKSISDGHYDKVYLLKNQIALYSEKGNDILFSNTLAGQSLENLKERRDILSSQINSNHMRYYSEKAGIISYSIDGYEDIYLAKDFENYTYDILIYGESKGIEVGNNINAGEPIYKIIDNFEWYIAFKVEELNLIEGFEVGDSLRVVLEGQDYELKSRIVSINYSGEKAVIVIKLNTMLHEFYNIRFSKVQIIKGKQESYRIPTKSIVKNDSMDGVYIRDKSGIVKFRPVIIIGEEDNYTYVDIGDNNGNIEINEDEFVRTIYLYDEIFLNTTKVKDGQILN